MSNKKDILEKDLLSEIDREKLFSEIQDNQMGESAKKNFLDNIMNNYFLDNDNFNFLEDNGIKIWEFSENENCICLEPKKYKDCCQLKLQPKRNENYISMVESLESNDSYNEYIKKMKHSFDKEIENFIKIGSCSFFDCHEKLVKSNLWDEKNFFDEEFFSALRQNVFDTRFTMGTTFFNKVDPKIFDYYGFCKEHSQIVSNNHLKISSSNDHEKILTLNFAIIAFKYYFAKNTYQVMYDEYINNYLSIEKIGHKAMMVFRLRKVINNLKEIKINFFEIQKALQKQDCSSFEFTDFDMKNQNNFVVRDIVQFAITPKNFTVINSVNNPFKKDLIAFMNVLVINKKTVVSFMHLKSSTELNDYFKEWKELNLEKKVDWETWISNNALILTDGILLNFKKWNDFNTEEKVLFSALNKFRFENPQPGQEYLKMKFFAGFNKGNNFF
ncbi:hypothetical protein SSABA_v1c04640 [Spiroplasma sabaudiense Ar-1343]|uniref:Uncharacterized protein n=1 Tax=Spiroplasma sabaudiense Ar-1343 TaxID=1276257 RepID=W6AA40_9MOLU|nr:hypothetical protein [Spiroplasma sabaudiense]AHI53871.1 hypothetical protein SSABA_v1c04640 [Spiroplasma sabaudiense Ar-1343]